MKHVIAAFVGIASATLMVSGCATTALEDFDNAYSLAAPDKTLAFVGRKIEVAQILEPGSTEDGDTIIINMDLGFAARYEILEMVHGDYDRRFIDFEAYDHYGYPAFARPDIAMIYVAEHDGRLYHRKYQWDPVNQTRDGRYAFCGDRYMKLDEYERAEVTKRPLQPLEFARPIVVSISGQMIPKERRADYDEEDIERNRAELKAFYSEPAFKVRGDRAICKMGVYADELYRIKYETMFLPEKRRAACEKETGYLSKDWQNKEKTAAVEACIAEKKSKKIP